ncbi:MAG: GIY-YIG nuclease family protein, partial [Candidatus Omnitrophica bacterium]|nr:GIY-YIG nuclease family protein [Candidatus Omnitrophota bacterium]
MKKNWFVYILECSDGSLYTGVTNNLERRLRDHNSGNGGKYTRSRTPVNLVYKKECIDNIEALKREAKIKHLTRSEKMVLLRNYEKKCASEDPIRTN